MSEQRNSTRHAYLIMAHNKFKQLKVLVELLDDPRNDIYLHIDKKVNVTIDEIKVRYSKLIFIDSISVIWGGHSQIACEMKLFKEASAGHYMYYHVLSGIDLPIKTQDEIHEFFFENRGCNFMELDEESMKRGDFRDRTQYYHLFQNIVGRDLSVGARCLRKLDEILVNVQKGIHLKRKEIIPLWKGANWVSITDELVQQIIASEKLIKKQFYYSICADEVFLQSIAMSSPYKDTVVNNYYREIDWSRGKPYIFKKEDIPMLLSSSALFARKFDEEVDDEVITFLVEHLKQNPKKMKQDFKRGDS